MNAKVKKYIVNLDLIISGITLTILIAVSFIGVLMRYFFNNPITWLEEFQLWCFVWLAFFGAGAAFRSRSHVAIEVVVDRLPSVPKKIVECISYLVTVAVFVYFLIYGTKLVQQLYFSGRVTNILKIPYSLIYSALPIGCALMIINYTVIALNDLGIIKAEIESGDIDE